MLYLSGLQDLDLFSGRHTALVMFSNNHTVVGPEDKQKETLWILELGNVQFYDKTLRKEDLLIC